MSTNATKRCHLSSRTAHERAWSFRFILLQGETFSRGFVQMPFLLPSKNSQQEWNLGCPREICSIATTTELRLIDRKKSHLTLWRPQVTATSDKMKLVHWLFIGGLLHLLQQGEAWVGLQPTQDPPCCTKCNSSPINGQCTSHHITVLKG